MNYRIKLRDIVFIAFCGAFFFAPISFFTVQGGSFVDFLPAFLLLVLFFFMSFNRKVYTPLFKTAIVVLFAFLLVLFLSCVLNSSIKENFRVLITYTLFSLFFFMFISIDYSKKYVKIFFSVFIAYALLSSLIIILSTILKMPYAYSRFSFNAIGVVKNPNYIVTFILCPYALLVYSLFFKNGFTIFKRVLLIIAVVIFLAAFLCSGTRSCILTAAIVLLLCFLKLVFSLKNVGRNIFIVACCLILAACFITVIPNFVPQATLQRLSPENIFKSEDNIRSIMWEDAFNYYFSSKPLLGLGVNGGGNYSNDKYGYILHNIPLQIVIDTGVIGFVLITIFIVAIFLRIQKHNRFFFIVFFVSLFVPLFFINGLYAVNFWFFVYVISFFAINQNKFITRGTFA